MECQLNLQPPNNGLRVCTVLDHGLREVTLQSFADEQYTPQDMCNSTSRSVIYLQHDSDLSACFCNHIVKYIIKILQQGTTGAPRGAVVDEDLLGKPVEEVWR